MVLTQENHTAKPAVNTQQYMTVIGRKLILSACLSAALPLAALAQGSSGSTITGSDRNKTIITALPFLTITPDARAGSMGDVGVATSPDANSAFWNAGKLNFIERPYGASVNYTPWLRNLATDVFISNLSGYYKLRKEDAIAAGFTYFNMGSLTFTDNNAGTIGTFNPSETALYFTYSRALSENFGVGATLRGIYSNLSGSISNSTGVQAQPVVTASVDLGVYYKKEISLLGNPSQISFGGTITNIGPKVSYSNNGRSDFIPTNLRLGTALTTEIDEFNKFTLALDANKLLVPTPDTGRIPTDINFFQGMIESLYKAPGGMQEKLSEVMIGVGAEYWYDDLFAVRAGLFHEAQDKGNRRYFTAGFGVRYQSFGLDVGYISALDVSHPLNQTLRFSLLFDFGATGKTAAPIEESVTQ